MRVLYRILRLPLDDYLRGLHACLSEGAPRAFGTITLAFLASWWVYVPIHELLHAFGCRLAGGTVTRLEIDPLYGAALLQRLFPFVAVGSDYAGQLTGFDTHGDDLTYLATDFLPFVLTVLVGIPLLRSAAAYAHRPPRASLELGMSLPLAYAPFISIAGDYYEMGSVLVSRCVASLGASMPLDRWRSDDLFKLTGQLFFSDAVIRVGDVAGVLASFLMGVALAFGTYWLGTLWAGVIVKRAA